MKKITLEEIKKIYASSDVCMAETLASIPAKGLNLEEAFELYIKAMQQCEGDRFFRQTEGEELEELLKEK